MKKLVLQKHTNHEKKNLKERKILYLQTKKMKTIIEEYRIIEGEGIEQERKEELKLHFHRFHEKRKTNRT